MLARAARNIRTCKEPAVGFGDGVSRHFSGSPFGQTVRVGNRCGVAPARSSAAGVQNPDRIGTGESTEKRELSLT